MAKRLTAQAGKALYQRKYGTFEFILERTLDEDGEPYTVLARIPDVTSFEDLRTAPSEQQQFIFRVINGEENLEDFQEIGEDADDPEALQDNLDRLGKVEPLLAYFVCQGFLEPRVYMTEEEAEEKGGVFYGVINYFDRIAFLAHCGQQQGAAAAVVAPFREEPAGPVDEPPAGEKLPGRRRSSGTRGSAKGAAQPALR